MVEGTDLPPELSEKQQDLAKLDIPSGDVSALIGLVQALSKLRECLQLLYADDSCENKF